MCLTDGWIGPLTSACAQQERTEAASNPSAKVLKRSVRRQEIASCSSSESFIKENAKRVELPLLYIQLRSDRMHRIQGAAPASSQVFAKRTLAEPSNVRLIPADARSLGQLRAGTHKSK